MPTQIAIPDVKDYGSLERYLSEVDDRQLTQAIAMRSAVRALPFVARAHPLRRYDRLTNAVLRATLISWVAAKFPTHEMSFAAAAAGAAAAANAAAANAVAAAAAGAAAAANAANAAAANAAAANAVAAADAAIWVQIRIDLAVAKANGSEALLASPLWQDEKASFLDQELRQSLDLDGAIPHEISGQIAAFESSLKNLVPDETPTAHWPLWMDWYEHVLDPTKHRPKYFTDENVKKLVDQDTDTFWGFDPNKKGKKRWTRDPQDVMADICALVGWKPGQGTPQDSLISDTQVDQIIEVLNTPGTSLNLTINIENKIGLNREQPVIEHNDFGAIEKERQTAKKAVENFDEWLPRKKGDNSGVPIVRSALNNYMQALNEDPYSETSINAAYADFVEKVDDGYLNHLRTVEIDDGTGQSVYERLKSRENRLALAHHQMLVLTPLGEKLADANLRRMAHSDLKQLATDIRSWTDKISQNLDLFSEDVLKLLEKIVSEFEADVDNPTARATAIKSQTSILKRIVRASVEKAAGKAGAAMLSKLYKLVAEELPVLERIGDQADGFLRLLLRVLKELIDEGLRNSSDQEDNDAEND